eukprot:scaffold202808_cov31-Tisochrysis_lutea.AAC.1
MSRSLKFSRASLKKAGSAGLPLMPDADATRQSMSVSGGTVERAAPLPSPVRRSSPCFHTPYCFSRVEVVQDPLGL